ncbi:MAG: M28 family peptidase [Calditrichia bacterium]|nr:M28 family peptidase [Calditrichia bacterium]
MKSVHETTTDELININSLRANMEFLSSEELEGREAGRRGEKILEFEQEKNFTGSTRYYDRLDTTAKLVFVGYGITADEYNYDDYADVNVEGKIVLIYPGEPENEDTTFFEGKKRTGHASIFCKIANASDRGAIGVISLSGWEKRFGWESIVSYVKKGKYQLMDQPVINKTNILPYITVNEQTFNELLNFGSYSYQELESYLAEQKTLPSFEFTNSARINWMFDTTGTVETRNVIGIIEGIDPDLKHEYIGIGAHYDHLGIGMAGIYNGADDNASGTAALLEIAKAFAKRWENKRSVLVTFHTAEEKGLLGSKYLVRDSTITNNMNAHINMDMIGRGSADSIYCLGSDKLSSELYDLVETVNADGVNIYLDYRLNNPNDPQRLYYRSDHYSYAKKNIPNVFFFDYEMEDYHRVTDDLDKINYSKIQKIARLVYAIALSTANRESKFKLDDIQEE